jgi:serine/threonine-protein kinase
MVTLQGTPKIMDFGVARRRLPNKPATWSLAGEEFIYGTPGYVAPEQLEANEIDVRADVFSLGIIAYEWLAGRKPFETVGVEATLKAVLNGRWKSLSEVGDFEADLSREIDQAVARDPAQRFCSADAMADALEICLEKCLKQKETSFPETEQISAFPRFKKRNVLFADFSEKELAAVMQMSRHETYKPGETILEEGAGGSTMYLVVKGRVSIRKLSGDLEIEIKQIGDGECFGEMAVMNQMPRSASAVALRPTELIAISGAVLRSASPVLCMKLYRNIASVLSERVRQLDEQVMSRPGNDQEKRRAKRFFSFW